MNTSEFFTSDNFATIGRITIILFIGFPLVFWGSKALGRFLEKRSNAHRAMIVRKAISILGSLILIAILLQELGFNLIAIFGAAGVLSIAIGFASQTSLSNIISGIFLYWEKPFQRNDIIQVEGTTGIVLSIDLMSVKLRQFDNLFVRIPNSTMLNTKVTTITRFPIRRLDVQIGVDYREDVSHVMRVMKEVAEANPYCLVQPAPLIIFQSFGDSSLDFKLGLWFEKNNFLDLKNSIMQEIKARFDEENISIPFPHRTLCVSSETTPFPIEIVHPRNEGEKVSHSAPEFMDDQ